VTKDSGDDWVQEPDDVEWSCFMQWSPDADIVPFRPEESLAWRLEAMRRDVARLKRETVTQTGDDIARLRRLGLLTGWLRDVAEASDRIAAERAGDDHRADAAAYTAQAVTQPFPGMVVQAIRRQRAQYSQIMDTVARHALELDPGCTLESRTSLDGLGEDVRVLLSTGDYVPSETVAQWIRDVGGEVLAVNVSPDVPAGEVRTFGDSIRSAAAAARSLADTLREYGAEEEEPRLVFPRIDPRCWRDDAPETRLVENRWDGLPWSETVAQWDLSVSGHLDPADFRALMGMGEPPTPDTFLAQVVQDVQDAAGVPGIESALRRDAAWTPGTDPRTGSCRRPRTEQEDAVLAGPLELSPYSLRPVPLPGPCTCLFCQPGPVRPRPTARDMAHRYRDRSGRLIEVRWYSGDGDPGVYVEVTGFVVGNGPRSLLPVDLGLPSGATVAQVISAAKERYVPELGIVQPCTCRFCRPPEDTGSYMRDALREVRADYERTTGLPFPDPGQADMVQVGEHCWIERSLLQTERIPPPEREPDVRGGHM
jgi:hypothetical protein